MTRNVVRKAKGHNDLDSQLAHGFNVIGYVGILTEKTTPIAKDIDASKKIDGEEERCRYAQSGKRDWIDVNIGFLSFI